MIDVKAETALVVKSLWKTLLKAAAIGLILGALAIYRVSPLFTPTDKLSVDWANEQDLVMKDNYLMFLLDRQKASGKKEYVDYLRPMVLLAYLRQGRVEEFEQQEAKLSDKFRQSTLYMDYMLMWVHELLRLGHTELAWKYFERIKEKWSDNAFIAPTLQTTTTLIALIEHMIRVNEIINKIEEKRKKGDKIDIDDLLFAQLAVRMAGKPDVPADTQIAFIHRYGEVLNEPVLFLERVTPDYPGLLDKFGKFIVDYVNTIKDPSLIDGINGTLLSLEESPDRWDEWQRFIHLVGNDSYSGLQNIRDYSQAFLYAARDRNFEKAVDLLQNQVLAKTVPEATLNENAKRLIDRIKTDPKGLSAPKGKVPKTSPPKTE
jgi:hypothetical protein